MDTLFAKKALQGKKGLNKLKQNINTDDSMELTKEHDEGSLHDDADSLLNGADSLHDDADSLHDDADSLHDDGDAFDVGDMFSDSDGAPNFVPRAKLHFQNHITCNRCVLTTCHCENLALNLVPQHLSSAITALDLSHNDIGTLPNKTFCVYPKLQFLILEENKLSRLEVDSFWCLSKLVYLNLKSNQLKMVHGAYPKGVFSPLVSLLVLHIQHNNPNATYPGYDYPGDALAELKSLRGLNMDGLNNKTFGPGFGNMTSLRSLSLSGLEGFCKLVDLSDETFEFLSHLRVLNISSCWITDKHLPRGIFAPLKQLSILDVQNNFLIGFKSFRRAMASLKNSSLTVLIANNIVSQYSHSLPVDELIVDILPKTLVYLEARGNCFEYLKPEVFSILPKGLRYIDVGSNRFVFGEYLQNLSQLEHLEILKLNGGGVPTEVPRTYPHQARGMSLLNIDSPSQKLMSEDGDLNLQLPPKLKIIDLSVATLKYVLSRLVVNSSNDVEQLILSNNYFPIISGPFIGFNKLQILDLSQSSIGDISLTFFENFPVLETLILDYNKLGDFFASRGKRMHVFEKLKNLKHLFLNDNGLTILARKIFNGLDSLETLYLGWNSNWLFDVTISHMRNLRRLNLAHTEVTGLPRHIRDHIDSLKNGIEVDLSHCPLHCDCENLDFLKWMVRSTAFDGSFRDYLCFYDDATFQNITDQFAGTLRFLERRCAENSTLFLIVLSTTLCLLCFVMGGVAYRFRWKLRYLYYMAYRNSRKNENPLQPGTSKYDVFISYASQDEAFVINEVMKELSARGLKLHVHGRDFAVGEYIASNIITAIHESRRTLVVLTRRLLASKWCTYELQMANMESVHTGRQVLVFLLKEAIPSRDLGTDLLYHIRNNTYILYPQADGVTDARLIGAFWDKLATDLARL
ncbi:unnamed protein product [Lymnaea stagnalis]|uniref:TIR domain-containing protein n=1 Tax=Lymnaea stagnalis TaxID=6523 RepID=A0AAV2IPW3_LYMST